MPVIAATGQSSWDFGNDFLSALTADGNDIGVLMGRYVVITGIQYRADANPGQTLTITLSRTATSPSGAGTASISVSTGGVITPTGFPLICVPGDRVITSFSGTNGVTGLSYTPKATSFGF